MAATATRERRRRRTYVNSAPRELAPAWHYSAPMPAAEITGIHHLGLTVRDAEVSAQWYSSILGFARIGDYVSPDHTRRKIFLGHSRLGVRIGLCEHERSGDEGFD